MYGVKGDLTKASDTFFNTNPEGRTIEENWQYYKTAMDKNIPKKTKRNMD